MLQRLCWFHWRRAAWNFCLLFEKALAEYTVELKSKIKKAFQLLEKSILVNKRSDWETEVLDFDF